MMEKSKSSFAQGNFEFSLIPYTCTCMMVVFLLEIALSVQKDSFNSQHVSFTVASISTTHKHVTNAHRQATSSEETTFYHQSGLSFLH